LSGVADSDARSAGAAASPVSVSARTRASMSPGSVRYMASSYSSHSRPAPWRRARSAAAAAGVLDLAGLAGLAALVASAPLLVSNNTGPIHVAAAVGTPVVDLYALTNPQHTPWGVPHQVPFHDVPCKYCYKSVCPEGHGNCLRLVEPEAVVEAARSLTRW